MNPINFSRNTRSERYIWQRRFWDHPIRDEKDLTHHIEYIHFNPVKHGYVNQVKDWEYSSFHSFVRQGLIDPSWGESYIETVINYGE
jgi:putative transposase